MHCGMMTTVLQPSLQSVKDTPRLKFLNATWYGLNMIYFVIYLMTILMFVFQDYSNKYIGCWESSWIYTVTWYSQIQFLKGNLEEKKKKNNQIIILNDNIYLRIWNTFNLESNPRRYLSFKCIFWRNKNEQRS